MNFGRLLTHICFVLFSLALVGPLQAQVRVAVASNFSLAFEALVEGYESSDRSTSVPKIIPIYGSTGKLYAQIINGAPFDAFFAADTDRPSRLQQSGYALPGSRFSYARGRLVLWSRDPQRVDSNGHVLQAGQFRRLAIANPSLAPYGAAAVGLLQSLGLYAMLENRLVRGENISQAFQYVYTGNAELGLVSQSQSMALGDTERGSFWLVPEHLHPPITQQAVSLKASSDLQHFIDFVRSESGTEIIRAHGYDIPHD